MGGSEATATFGARLRLLREAAGLSQEQLAARAGLTAKGISALERGARRHPYPHTVQALADALVLADAERAALHAAAPRREGMAFAHASAASSRAPLPQPVTPLVGRERDTAALEALQGAGPGRLLTLVGPGGVGKTRLALHLAHAGQHAFADGVVFVALAPVADPAHVLAALVAALGLREGDQPLPQLLAGFLRDREVLLVLDNCEHVVAAAPQVGALLAACLRVRVLATSRTPLRLQGEQEYPVAPLAVPALDHVPALAEVAASPAVQIFVQRAQAVMPSFALTQANAAALAAICRRLDGLPLALELAAARIKLFPPTALLARLDRSLPLLTGGARDLPDRQRTLRAALAWSYDLLAGAEQTLFRRLAVFVGGWTVAAAQAICADDGTAGDVLEGLEGLVEQSLVRPEGSPPTAEGSGPSGTIPHGTSADGSSPEGSDLGEPRFDMLETIRDYACELLEANEEEGALRQAHAAYYLALAEAAALRLQGAEAAVWLDQVAREHSNLRAALTWARERGDGTLGLRLAVALWPFWLIRGHLSEGRLWLERLLAVTGGGAAAPGAVRAEALTGAAWLAQPQHDYAASIPWLEESVAVRQSLGLPDGLTDLLIHRALQARAQGDYTRAVALLEESVARHRALGNRAGIASRGLGLSLSRLGMVWREQGNLTRAMPLYEECLALHLNLSEREGMAVALLGLGDIARDRGDAERASACCEESYAIFAELGDRWGMGVSLNNLALAAYSQGELERAGALAERGLALLRALGSEPSIAEALLTLGRIMAARGDAAGAARALAESLTLVRVRGPRFLVPLTLEALAALAVRQERALVAARLLGAAATVRGAIGASVPLVYQPAQAQTLALARAALDPVTFAAAWAAGETMPLAQALSEAQAFAEAVAVSRRDQVRGPSTREARGAAP